MPIATLTALISAGGVIVPAAAILVTVILWRSDARRRRRDEEAGRRRELIEQLIRLAERSARHAPFSLITQAWFHPELEWALLLPRLYYQLSVKERPVATWVALRVQLIQGATTATQIVKLGGEIAYRLASWEHNETPLSWFAKATEGDSFPTSWTVPRVRRALQMAVHFWGWLKLDALIAAACGAIWFAVHSFRKS